MTASILHKLALLGCLTFLVGGLPMWAQRASGRSAEQLPFLLSTGGTSAVLSVHSEEESEPAQSGPGLGWPDWFIIAGYALGMLSLGYYFSRRQRTTSDYFIAGGTMGGFVVGTSLFATLLSTISYLAQPGEVIKHGPVVLSGHLSMPLVFLVVGYLLIPVYMKQRVTSGYQLLIGDS